MISTASSPTLADRVSLKEEYLLFDQTLHFTAFSTRPGDRSISCRLTPTPTLAKINTNHKLRTSPEQTTIIFPLKNFQTWKDAGDLEPMIPGNRKVNYNSNIWRSFSAHQDCNFSAENRKTSELIASMYPIPIPPPSNMGEYTYTRFIKYGDIYPNDNTKAQKISVTEKELKEMKVLKMKTEARIPPMFSNGIIAPPLALRRQRALHRSKDYTSYKENLFSKNKNDETIPSRSASLASRSTSLRQKGLLWKFSYKLNNPQYEIVLHDHDEVRRWKETNAKRRRAHKQTMQQRLILHYQP